MSLRSEAVEAIAQQVHAQQIENTNFPIAWENCAHIYRVASRLKAETVLDVLLDFLDEHTEAWVEAEAELNRQTRPQLNWQRANNTQVLRLVAALRGTTEEP